LISTPGLLSLKQAAAVAGMTAAADATETRDPSRNARRNIVDMAPRFARKTMEEASGQ
jgi:hypothetical protein